MVMQCLGAICGAGVVKGFMGKKLYGSLNGGANFVAHGYTKGDGLGAEIIGTFVLVYTVFSATDAKRSARDSHVPVSYLPRSLPNNYVLTNTYIFVHTHGSVHMHASPSILPKFIK